MKRFIPCLLIALAASAALAQTVSDDDLTKGDALCRRHLMDAPKMLFEPGWEQCAAIEQEIAARDEAKRKSSAFVNGLADKLKKAPAQ